MDSSMNSSIPYTSEDALSQQLAKQNIKILEYSYNYVTFNKTEILVYNINKDKSCPQERKSRLYLGQKVYK